MSNTQQKEIVELTQENFATVLSQVADEANDVTRELKKHFPLFDMFWLPHYNSPDRWLVSIQYKLFYTDTHICTLSYFPKLGLCNYSLIGRKESLGVIQLPSDKEREFNQVSDIEEQVEKLMLFVQLEYGQTPTRYYAAQ